MNISAMSLRILTMRKILRMRLKIIFFLCISLSSLQATAQLRHINYYELRYNFVQTKARMFYDSVKERIPYDPCGVLKLISDSVILDKRFTLMYNYAICDYFASKTKVGFLKKDDNYSKGAYGRATRSYEKSNYWMYVLLWMRKYHCADSSALKNKVHGQYPKWLAGWLMIQKKMNPEVDTVIFDQK